MLYTSISVVYTAINLLIALIIFFRSRTNLLSQFYTFCVGVLVSIGIIGWIVDHPIDSLVRLILENVGIFLYVLLPFFFLHFVALFSKSYDILRSKSVIISIYFAGFISYSVVMMGYVPKPISEEGLIASNAYMYYLIWMSIFFSIGTAMLYSLIGGFSEKGINKNFLLVGLALLLLILPSTLTEAVFLVAFQKNLHLYFFFSTSALTIAIYLIFRHKIIINTPYDTLKTTLSVMNDILIKTDENFRIELVRGGSKSLLGYSEEELIGKTFAEILEQKDLVPAYRDYAFRRKMKESFFETDVICKNGFRRMMSFSLTPVFGNEEIIGFAAVGRNIDERKLVELSPDAIAIFHDHRIVFINPAGAKLLGAKEPDAMLGKAIEDFIPSASIEIIKNSIEAMAYNHRESPVIEINMKHLDGKPLWVDARAIPFSHQEKPAVQLVLRDVTERKLSQIKLKHSEERYRSFFDDDLTGDFIATNEGMIIACNPAFIKLFGFSSKEEACRTNVALLFPRQQIYQQLLNRLKREKRIEYLEMEVLRRDGRNAFVVTNLVGIFDESGNLTEIKGYLFDDSKRHHLEQQLIHAQKLESVGTLAGGIAHDFNNILSIILGHATMATNLEIDSQKLSHNLHVITKATQRGASLVKQLLTFAQKTDVVLESISVNDSIRDVTKLLHETFPKTIAVSTTFEDQLPHILADSTQINQVFLNLCVNARDAMPDGGILSITTKTMSGNTLRNRFPKASSVEYIQISLTDTGIGMDEETKNRVFEPFFTTKGRGKGTGLGLAVVFGIIEGHNGFIDVSSEPGNGTTFTLYFPVKPHSIEKIDIKMEHDDEIPGGTETILVVEDEEMIRDMIKELLEDNGYTVLDAVDGSEAIHIYKQYSSEISLVLSDLGLPKLNGHDVLKKLKEIDPYVKLIIASGYIEPREKSDIFKSGAKEIIHKPYVPAEMLFKIRTVLDAP